MSAERSPPLPTVLRWLARGLFAAALAAALFGWWRRDRVRARVPAPAPYRAEPLAIDWRRERFRPWSSAEDGVRLEHPERFEPVRGFGRFTSRDLKDGLVETDVVAFRCGAPRAVIVVALYQSPRARSFEEWVSLARAEPEPPQPAPPAAGPFRGPAPAAFSMEFGGSHRSFRRLRLGERSALAVEARGAVQYPARGNPRMELWHFESRLVALGDRAARITAGVHTDQHAAAAPGLRRTLDSFRWEPSTPLGLPPGAPGPIRPPDRR